MLHQALFYLLLLFCSLIFSAFPSFAIFMLFLFSGMDYVHIDLFGSSWGINHVVLGLFLMGMTIRFMLENKKGVNNSWIPLSLIALSGFISVPFSINPLEALKCALISFGYLAAAFCITETVNTNKRATLVLSSVYGVLIIMAFMSIIQFINASNTTLSGGFSNPNFYAIAVAMSLPLLLLKSKQNMRITEQNILVILFYVLWFIALASRSKSGGFILIVLLISAFSNGLISKNHIVWCLPAFIVGVFQFIATSGNITLIEHISRWLENTFFKERIANSFYSLMAFIQHPFAGVGCGQYEAYTQWAYPQHNSEVVPHFSSFFILMAERGLAGIVTVIWFIVELFKKTVQLKDVSDFEWIYKATLTSLIIIACGLVLHSIHTQLFTWCWLALFHQIIVLRQKENRTLS